MTTTSLLERATALPARSAFSVGARPATPVVATITRSTSGAVTISAMGVRFAAPMASGHVMRGANSSTCFARSPTLAPAARPTTRNRSGSDRTTSNVCVPIDPVEPRTTMFFMVGILSGSLP